MADNETTATVEAAPESAAPAETIASDGYRTDDDVLGEMFGRDESPAKTPAEPKPDDKAKDQPKGEEPKDKPADSKAEPDPSIPPTDIEKAMRALQRDGLSAKAIERMLKEDPADFVKTGLKRAKVQGDGDRIGSELGELRRKLAEFEKAKADAPRAQPAPAESLITREVRELYPELAGVFDGYDQRMQALQSQWEAKLTEALGAAQSGILDRVNFVGSLAIEQEIKQARSQLEGKFPKLKDADEFATVRAEADKLLRGGVAESIPEAFEKASQNRYFYELLADGQRAREQLSKAKDAGQPAKPNQAAMPSGAASKETLDDQWLRIADERGVQAANAWLEQQRATQ